MRILGIDYGEKRIGLAVSDETFTIAKELGILAPKEFFKRISGLIREQEVGEAVLGWPLNLGGTETKKTQEVAKFKAKLEAATGLKVSIMDERLSSQMAQHLPGGNKNVDSLAAQIILQNHLDKLKKQN